ncbi:hypothetical protein UNDYM_1564 [Undibacterium sp. YM2]|nr:hypothetical protein UNDYM_1564 [Undibacterium sp. YM2]
MRNWQLDRLSGHIRSEINMEDKKMEDINKHIDPSMTGKIIFYWALACVPLGWGVWQTAMKVMAMFA